MKIAILSRNKRLYSTKRLKEAAEARGHEVDIIDTFLDILCLLYVLETSRTSYVLDSRIC